MLEEDKRRDIMIRAGKINKEELIKIGQLQGFMGVYNLGLANMYDYFVKNFTDNTGKKRIPLKEIIEKLGNKDYDFIEFRYIWTDENEKEQDIYTGACSYKDGILTQLDEDSYSLDDLYNEWKETSDGGQMTLTVWEYGEE